MKMACQYVHTKWKWWFCICWLSCTDIKQVKVGHVHAYLNCVLQMRAKTGFSSFKDCSLTTLLHHWKRQI